MNLFTTSAGIVLIGVLTLSVTRPDHEAPAPAPGARVTLGVYDSRALTDGELALIEDELPHIAREAGVDVIVSERDLTYRDAAAEVVDLTSRLTRALDAGESPSRADQGPRRR